MELPRKLGLLDSAGIVMGTVIGSGIFIVPGALARDLHSTGAILAVWLAAGLLTCCGAMAYAELGAMMPYSGGQYVYLREAYGRVWAFLFGWVLLLSIRSGSTATLAVGFSIYLGYFLPLSPLEQRLAAAGLILTLAAVNCRGVKLGAAVQNGFLALKVAGILVLLAGAFAWRAPSALEWSARPESWSATQFGIAMIACLWTYNGWFHLGFVAGEIREPGKNLPRGLALGQGLVMALYLAANLAYLHVLPLAEIARTDRVAAVMAERVFGPAGAALVSLTILVSIVGAANGGILAAPRVYFAQARDGLFFRRLAQVHPRWETPVFSILLQAGWAALLALTGSYEKLFSFAMFTAWIFYGMTVAALIVLRVRQPDRPRPYKMWGYPVTPLLFAGVSAAFVLNTLISRPGTSLIGLLIIASGLPVYWLWARKGRPQPDVVRAAGR